MAIAATKIELWPTGKLVPYAKNSKKHPPEQIDRLAALIERHGFDVPIVVDKDGVVVKGHGRLLAAKKLGLKKIPVVIRDDLTPAQAAEARVADNRVAEYGWDFDALVEDTRQAMDLEGFDLAFTGFSAQELGLVMVEEHLRDVNGSKEISAEEIGVGEHECPRCSFKFD